jgi:hypothetical protein
MPDRLQDLATWFVGIPAAFAIVVKGVKAMWKIGANTKRILELAETNDARTYRLEREINKLLHRVRALDGGPGEMAPVEYAEPEGQAV